MKLIVVLSLLLALGGCAAPGWTVIQQEPSSSLTAGSAFAVLPMDTSAIANNAESAEDVLKRKGFAAGSLEVTQAFSDSLEAHAVQAGKLVIRDDPTQAAFLVRTKITSLDPGLATTVYSRPSKLVMQVSIEDKSGRVLDVIEVQSSTDAQSAGEMPAQRYKQDLSRISRRVVEYLSMRSVTSDRPTL